MAYNPLPTRNEDDPATSGDGGLPILGVRQDADVSPVSTDGDYHAVQFNNNGRLKVSATPADYAAIMGAITASGQSVTCDTSKASNVIVYCTGTFAGSNCTFEGSIDGGTTWFGVQAARTNVNAIDTATGVLSAAPAYAWELSVNAITNMRVRATAFTSGTQNWRIQPGAYATEPIPAIQTHAITGTVTANWGALTTGASYNLVTAATTNAAIVKASAGAMYEISISNVTATAVYVKLYNKASAPTVGTDVPIMTITAAASATVTMPFGVVGKRFVTGIAISVTGAAIATDTTATAAGVQIGVTYI